MVTAQKVAKGEIELQSSKTQKKTEVDWAW
jgi:hypothetical protein